MAAPDPARSNPDQNPPADPGDSLRSWVMIGLPAVFVALYVAALFGVIDPLPDNAVVLRLEPIVAVIIGYYFGRVPGEKNEKALKEAVSRETAKAKEEEQKKEKAQQEKTSAEREAARLDQKVNSTRAALAGAAGDVPQADAAGIEGTMRGSAAPPVGQDAVAAALRVLDS
ncbi:MAG TPA: hypothetical protein VFQ76_16630 [Longimicrobiaceae bacterium]|nr:hypothetical protein [Longimicrobiaceae bacterium]